MGTDTIPTKRRLFTVRADWRDETQYPAPNVEDTSIWAWELLRRSTEYVHDYRVCKDVCVDVPAIPYPMDTLTYYICEPDPTGPNMLYKDYSKQHRRHFVYPVKDAVRRKWQINEMPDPDHGWKQLLDQRPGRTSKNNQLARLFACNTVDVINPPDRWTIGTRVALPVTGFCVDNEVLVRLNLTGNLDEQIESLRQQIAGFFTGGNRSGGLTVGEYMSVGDDKNIRYDAQRRTVVDAQSGLPPSPIPWPVPDEPAVRPLSPDWNKIPARQKSLHYVLRMADAIASTEAGTLVNELSGHRVDVADISVIAEQMKASARSRSFDREIHYRRMRETLFPALSKVLVKYFSLRPFADDARDVDYKAILRWLSLAGDLIVKYEYTTIARMNTVKRRK